MLILQPNNNLIFLFYLTKKKIKSTNYKKFKCFLVTSIAA